MASGGGSGFSYRPNVNRNVTKKWREASRPTYDDDDEWGDDGYGTYDPPPIPAPSSRPGWSAQMPPPNRSFTNPSPPRSTGRASFDRGDDRRYVSTGSGFESAYPSTQRSPFPEPRHEEPPQQRFYAQHPPLHVNTHGQGPFQPPSFRPSSRGSQQSGHADVPFSAPGAYGQQRSHSGNRPGPGGFSHRQGSPARPDSRSSNHSNRMMPPRKSSLGQEQHPVPNFPAPTAPEDAEDVSSSNTMPAKALPFIRPSDIYKRMEEEKERERRSMDSSRPSLDLTTTRSRDSAATAKSVQADAQIVHVNEGDSDSARRLRTTLDPVPERKSEYGLETHLKNVPAIQTLKQSDGMQRHDTTASSVYTDRPDPVSASTDDNDDAEPNSAFSFQPDQPTKNHILGSGADGLVTSAGSESTSKMPPKSTGEGAGDSLDYRPSVGYRSVVQQAFDDSQKRGPNSPTSTADTIPRSNSASTSELSPIISRKHDQPAGFSGHTATEPVIPEEPASASSNRPLSDATITGPTGGPRQPENITAPAIQPGYRRDDTPPNSGSPARKADIRHSDSFEPHQGVLATTAAVADNEEQNRGRDPSAHGVISPSASQTSGVSEEFSQWQAQSKQFNSNLGVKESSPSRQPPILRAESPPKGAVKGLASKYEGNSGRSTPVSALCDEAETVRPSQARLESFRPVIPGGWQSYSATPAANTPQQELSSFPMRLGEQRHDSTDSIPTAKAPQGQQSVLSTQAFAAAAAAGSALAGSFSGPAMTGKSADTSDDESENEWDRSSTSSKGHPQTHDVRDFGATPGDSSHRASDHDSEPTPYSYATTPSDVLGKDTPSEAGAGQSTMDYFPAPLRMSRSSEASGVLRPPVTNRPSIDDSVQHGDNEELQESIVKSLTPRSSNFETHSKNEPAHQNLPALTFAINHPQRDLVTQESDDMYGGRSTQHTPSAVTPTRATDLSSPQAQPSISSMGSATPPARGIDSTSHQPQFSVSSTGSAPHQPFLKQRFSWEMEKVSGATVPIAATAATLVEIARPSTPPTVAQLEGESPETPKAASSFGQAEQSALPDYTSRPTSSRGVGDRPLQMPGSGYESEDSHRLLPVNAAAGTVPLRSFQNIMKLGSQQDRIKAFEDNRSAYGHSDGQLDNWLQSMQTPEHADIFNSNGRVWKESGPGNSASQPQRAPSSRPMGNISGGRVMQEDGKKLMAAAGRFSGKAGVAAKGLFARGKDKLRATSASEKDFQDKRKSVSPLPTIVDNAGTDDNSVEAAPRLPANDMILSPLDESKWFAFDRDGETKATNDGNANSHLATTNQLPNASAAGAATTGTASLAATALSANTMSGESNDSATSINRQDTVHQPGHITADQNSSDPALRNSMVRITTNEHHRKVSDLTAADMAPSRQTAHLRQPSQMLDVGDERRNSNVSAISSPSPAHSNTGFADRSISPAVQDNERADPAPGYHEAQEPTVSKDEEAVQAQTAAADQHDPVPEYEEVAQKHRPQIGPDAQILPVADLGTRARAESAVSSRPFSFEGSEALRQAQQAYIHNQQGQDGISQSFSPVSQTVSKDPTQVSAEEVSDDRPLNQNRQSRSYSRPFGTEHLGQHPAFRTNEQQREADQLVSSQAPVTDARRLQEEAAKYRQQLRPTEEQGYRIPGPYHQEYRSPKPRSTPTPSPTAPQNQRTQNSPSVRQVTDPEAAYEDYGEKRFPITAPANNTMGPPPVHDQPHPAKRSFGAFFRAKSKPRQGSNDRDETFENAKRPGFFSRNSRQESVTSQTSSQNESRDQLGQLPSAAGRKQNRLSKDYYSGRNTPTQHEPDVPTDKKKKRFSAMGNLFSKSDKPERATTPQRSTTLPSNSVQPDRGQYQPQQGQYQSQNRDPRSQQHQYPGPNHGYQGQGPPEHHNYTDQAPQSNSQSQHLQHYPAPATHSPHPNNDSRPSDLRIDTSGHGGRRVNHPASAPPQTYAHRDLSYEGTNPGAHNPINTYQHSRSAVASSNNHASPPTTRAPTSAAPSSARPTNIDAHVMQLHKRSRSPTSEARRRSQLAPPLPEEDVNDPAGGLGTFMNKKYSPVDGVIRKDGEQEKPWRIGIPGAEGGEERRRTRQVVIEQGGWARNDGTGNADDDGHEQEQQQLQQRPPTVAERMMAPSSPRANPSAPATIAATTLATNANSHPTSNIKTNTNTQTTSLAPDPAATEQPPPIPKMSPNRSKHSPSNSRDGRKGGYVAELPGSKAEGYESEEEITMSATVRPGDWDWNMPVFVDDDVRR